MKQKKKLFLVVLFLVTVVASSQEMIEKNATKFILEVQVIDQETNKSIENATVSINGIHYAYRFTKDRYLVEAMIGQQLIVEHPAFKTVYYMITTKDDVTIKVKGFSSSKYVKKTTPYRTIKKTNNFFLQNLDSATYYKDKNIDKSISYIEKLLKQENSAEQEAAIYQLLGAIYMQWNQYDLAISSYKTSLQSKNKEAIKLQIANAFFASANDDQALSFLLKIKIQKLGFYDKILVYELLGDVYLNKKEFIKARTEYNKGIAIAEKNLIVSKITDLQSKLANLSAAEGDLTQANTLFNLSLDLASKESPFRSLEEKEKVANYFNKTQQFDKEIHLRKKALQETNKIEHAIRKSKSKSKSKKRDDTFENKRPTMSQKSLGKEVFIKNKDTVAFQSYDRSVINSQSINYKIGRALVEKESYKKAIPFLKKSIKDAATEKDLVVKKDATRKLSEVYANVGEYDKALQSYQEYVSLVDSLYVRKEQEIAFTKRFSKRISENQNRIASLEKNKALHDSKISLALKDQQLVEQQNKTQQLVIYSLLGGMLLLFVLAITLFKSNKQQKLANNLLALKSMRSQMNPHFIFNALNSVNSFIAVNDERNANRYLSEFSVLMRSVLENSDEDFIPFSKEIALLELYVKLEHNRFKEKFDYTISVDESIQVDDFSIPPMLLQPYIENAIWHGLRYKETKGTLEIMVTKISSDSISVLIKDNGVGRKKSKELKTKNQRKQKSKGLSTIQKRIEILNNMYRDRISVQVSDVNKDGSGTKVVLILKKN